MKKLLLTPLSVETWAKWSIRLFFLKFDFLFVPSYFFFHHKKHFILKHAQCTYLFIIQQIITFVIVIDTASQAFSRCILALS